MTDLIKIGEDSFFPVAFFAPHADQAQRNHCKSVEEIKDLSWPEALAILKDESLRKYLFDGAQSMARPLVEEMYEQWRKSLPGEREGGKEVIDIYS